MVPSVADRILIAVQEILIHRGIEDVTIRNVAAAADVSVGGVQHHYSTKDELLMAAMDKVSEEFITSVTSAVKPEAPSWNNLAALSHILGSVANESRNATVIWLAYASKATTSPTVAQAHQESWRQMEKVLTTLLKQLNPALGHDDAAMLMALLDGIAIARATETDRMTPQRAQHLIDRFLSQFDT